MRNVTLFASAGVDVKTTGTTTVAFDVSPYEALAFFVNLTALAGGTTPSVQLVYQEADDFGVWYDVTNLGAALTAVGGSHSSVGEGAKVNEVIGKSGRLKWTVTGGPTTATASLTVLANDD